MAPIPCPEYFDEYARAEWERVCRILFDKGTLQDVNHATLEGYCSAYSKAKRADDTINKEGFSAKVYGTDREGNVTGQVVAIKKLPEVDIAFKAWGQVKMFAVEMGITSAGGKEPEPDEGLTPLEKALREAERKPK